MLYGTALFPIIRFWFAHFIPFPPSVGVMSKNRFPALVDANRLPDDVAVGVCNHGGTSPCSGGVNFPGPMPVTVVDVSEFVVAGCRRTGHRETPNVGLAFCIHRPASRSTHVVATDRRQGVVVNVFDHGRTVRAGSLHDLHGETSAGCEEQHEDEQSLTHDPPLPFQAAKAGGSMRGFQRRGR